MTATVQADEDVISRLRVKLEKGDLSLTQKYRVLFSLRNCSNASALEALLIALKDDSALFRHDVAFALGQRQDADALEALRRLLVDASEHCMVRHEAGEALGAIGTAECMEPLEQYMNCPVREVAETCVLAKQRMDHFEGNCGQSGRDDAGPYQSVDPTPPFPSSMPIKQLQEMLLSEDAKLFDRYRALFALRNRGGKEAIAAMEQCIRTSASALLKHEIAYVFGQMLDKDGVQCLKEVLQDEGEHAMVRHEAAEALGAIADDSCVQLLQEYSTCSEAIVADSCIVALDMLAHEQSGAFEYADMGE